MTLDSRECPVDPEEVAETYIMGTLPKPQSLAFEDHYVGCHRCAVVLQAAAEYMAAMRGVQPSSRRGRRVSFADPPRDF